MEFDRMIESIKSAGYYPLLAHPERYTYMDESDYKKLRDKGVRMQLNYVSLVGGYGETSRKKSIWLLKNGYIDVIGSDIHRLKSNQTLIEEKPEKKEHLDLFLSVVNEKNSI
ncbi:MAG: capsular biosynthesis protein, partial [Muribaculaceae bacterium]|nr:capsular biosynthesis protein [Muribaculaceae bacterium]